MAELIEVKGTDGTSAFIDAGDVRAILPATEEGGLSLPPSDEKGVPIIGGAVPTITKSIVAFKTPGAGPLVIDEAPESLADRVMDAR